MTVKPYIHPVILSGGSGTRLWPLSRKLHPKQLLKIGDDTSLLQKTVMRFSGAEFANPLVVCNHEHRFTVAEQIVSIDATVSQIILEPIAKNTAAAAIIAALFIEKESPGQLMLITPSDHMIEDSHGILTAISSGKVDAERGEIVIFGISPDSPHTGYGYIQTTGQKYSGGSLKVTSFVEKPDKASALKMIESDSYYWNSGILLCKSNKILEEAEKYTPEILQLCKLALDLAVKDLDFLRLDSESFDAIESTSLDYAIMEKTSSAALIPINIGWDDVGSWNAMWSSQQKDTSANALVGEVVALDSSKNFLMSTGPLLAASGIENLVVVATPDAVLVVPREMSENVRDLVELIRKEGYAQHDSHSIVIRPWGSFQVLHSGEGYQVKKLVIKPGAEISLQYHNKRAEHWVVVGGSAQIKRDEDDLYLNANESTYIPVGSTHRLSNHSEEELIVIEVQTGDYLDEDDIVRLEDRYGRIEN